MRIRLLLLALLAVGPWLPPGIPAPDGARYTLYLPLLMAAWPGEVVVTGNWQIIQPEAATNEVLNPIAGATGNFAALGGATATRVTTYARFGVYSYRVQTAGDNEGVSLTVAALDNADHYVTLRVRGTIPAWDWSLDDATYTAPSAIETQGDWTLYGLSVPAAQANGATTLYIRQNGAGAGDMYIDGVDVVAADHWTTHIDGEREGCAWNGAAHASTATRSGQSLAGGRVYDLYDDYSFRVRAEIGAGAGPLAVTVDGFAVQPGGRINDIAQLPRNFTLVGQLVADDAAGLWAARKALRDALSSTSYPQGPNGWQPVRLRFTGGSTPKEIAVFYQGGLEGSLGLNELRTETVSLNLLAPQPNWGELGESAAVLDTNDSATSYHLVARLASTGQWSNLGLTNVPSTLILGGLDVLVATDGRAYIGGDFTGFNGNDPAGSDYVVRYDPVSEAFELVGNASDLNLVVYMLREGPDGKIYACGRFTNAGGDADADNIAVYDPSTDSWAAVGTPNTGAAAISVIYAMDWDSQGNLYIVGSFQNLGDVANADYIAKWDGSAWSAVGSGGTGIVTAIAIDADDNVYIGGSFTNWASDADADYWAVWNGTTWASVNGIALNNNVFSMMIDSRGNLYAGGAFTNAGGDANADYIFKYTGSQIEALGSSVNNVVRKIEIAPDDTVWAIGDFTEAGGNVIVDRVAVWNGASWVAQDINFSGAGAVYGIGFSAPDPIVKNKFTVYLCYTLSGTDYFAGDTDVENDGNVAAYPQLVVERSGGTSARLVSLRNERTGATLYFDYSLLDGETLTVDLDPLTQSIDSSFFGPRPDALLAGSDDGEWRLQPGENPVTCFVDVAGAPTVTAYLLWQAQFDGYDD